MAQNENNADRGGRKGTGVSEEGTYPRNLDSRAFVKLAFRRLTEYTECSSYDDTEATELSRSRAVSREFSAAELSQSTASKPGH